MNVPILNLTYRSLLFVLFFWQFTTYSQKNTELFSHGLPGKIIRSYAINAADSKQIMVGIKGKEGDGKVYLSNNDGLNWSPLNNDQPLCASCSDVQSVCFIDDHTFLAGTWKNGLFLSEDEGKTFKPVAGVVAKDIRSIVRAPMGTVYIATTTHGILKSEDKGKTWISPHGMDLNKTLNCWGLKIAPRSNQILYALTFKDGIYKSLDGGSNWKQTLFEKDIMLWDMGFTRTEVYAVGSNESGSYLFHNFMGDKSWKKFKLNIPEQVNSMEVLKTFSDYILLFGTWSGGAYKSYAIEYSIAGYKCIELIKDDTTGVAALYSNDAFIYNFSWGDGIKIIEREKECGVSVPKSAAPEMADFEKFKIESTCPLDYLHFRLFDKWGKEVLRDSADINHVNQVMNTKANFEKADTYVYWLKASFEDERDTFNLKGHINVIK